MHRAVIHLGLSAALVTGAACTNLAAELPYDPDDRAIETGEILPDVMCAPRGSIPDGDPCECSTGCASGVCATEEYSLATQGYGLVQGMCIRACEGDDQCGPGYACIRDGTALGVCFLECETVDTCPPTRTCGRPFGEGSPRVCIPLCQGDSECRGGSCDLYTGSCGGMSDPTLGGLSADCTDPSECRGGSCLVAGICSAHCSVARQGCPEDGVCIENGDGDDSGACLKRCVVDSDCPHVPRRCVYWPEADGRGCL
jgi:hypothetical protein